MINHVDAEGVYARGGSATCLKSLCRRALCQRFEERFDSGDDSCVDEELASTKEYVSDIDAESSVDDELDVDGIDRLVPVDIGVP